MKTLEANSGSPPYLGVRKGSLRKAVFEMDAGGLTKKKDSGGGEGSKKRKPLWEGLRWQRASESRGFEKASEARTQRVRRQQETGKGSWARPGGFWGVTAQTWVSS